MPCVLHNPVRLILALSVQAAATAAAAQAPIPAPAASAPAARALRAEVASALDAAVRLLQAGKAAEALAQVRAAEAVPAPTPLERQVTARMKGSAALALKDEAAALQAFQQALDTGTLSADERQPLLAAMVRSAVALAQPAAVRHWGRQYVQDGGRDADVRTALARGLQAGGDSAAAAQELRQVVDAQLAGDAAPREDILLLLARLQNQLKDDTGFTRTLERLVAHHPKPAYWADLVARVQGGDDFADCLTLDAFRLLRHVQALRDAIDYTEMARLATRAGLPAEALAVLDEGLSRNLLGQGADAAEHRRLRERAAASATSERGQLAGEERGARAASDGAALVALGQALVSHGDAVKGSALVAEGLAKGLRTHADDARLRLGVLLLQQGRRAEAETTLRAVGSRDGAADLARLWLLVR